MARRKSDRKRAIITQLKRFDYGKEQINRLLAPVSFVLSLFTLLKVYNISYELEQITFLSLVVIAVMFAVGYFWDKKGYVEEEIEYQLERNRFVRAMLGSDKNRNVWLKKLQGARIR